MSDAALRRLLHGLPGVDQVGAEASAAALATRSIKKDAKLWALDMAVRMIDLTTLEGADTPGKVRALCAKARRPDPADPAVPPVAAVCVYPDLVPVAGRAGAAARSRSPRWPPRSRPAAPRWRSSWPTPRTRSRRGADEVDMVIDRGAFLAGRYGQVYEEIVAVKQACGDAHLKVILETGELATLDNVARASWLAMLAGADFIKTSTGKVSPAATPPVALVMLTAVRDYAQLTGQPGRGQGGRRDPHRQGRDPLPGAGQRDRRARTGSPRSCSGSAPPACSTTCCMQRRKQLTGVYAGPDDFTVD